MTSTTQEARQPEAPAAEARVGEFPLLVETSPPGLVGRSYGISFFAAFGLGSSAASFAGFFAERWGTGSVFLSLAAFALLVLSLTLVMLRMSGKRRGLAVPGAAELPADLTTGGRGTGGLQ